MRTSWPRWKTRSEPSRLIRRENPLGSSSERRSDLDSIFEFLTEHNPRAAVAIVRRIGDAAAGLAARPRIGRPGKLDGTRERVVSRTAYLIIYKVLEDEILIARVLHGRQQWPPESERADDD